MCADTPDYKDTLFLPATSFPMRAGLPQREPEWLARWERIGVYDRLRERAEGRTPFVLHDGPPYANGHLHIGHALNKVLKDFVVRSQQMLGRDSRYVPGWDCHGLPIEWKIEEQYRARGLSKDAVPVAELRAECRKFAENWVGVQREEFKRLGVTGKWDNPYLTMDFHAEAVIADEFMKFVMNGALYLGSKPVMWSPVEKTALAEAEVEYRERQSHQVWVRFPVSGTNSETVRNIFHDPNSLPDFSTPYTGFPPNTSVVIWTTTPWTIPQNRAVAFSERIHYCLYEVKELEVNSAAQPHEYLIAAETLSHAVMQAARVKRYEYVRHLKLDELRTLMLAHPLRGIESAGGEWDFEVPILPGDHVTDETGTGFVHTAPSHGDDDYQLGVKHGLAMTYNVVEDGSFRADLPLFGAEHIILPDGKEGTANVSVIKQLAYAGMLLAKGKLTHSYPHSWRSKAPVIYRNTPQWFVAIDKPLDDGMGEYGATIRERALTSIDALVEWTPQTGRNRLHAMVEARPDWVLSRQRAWGVPLTAFVKRLPEGRVELLRDPAVNALIRDAFEAEGADAWYAEGAKARFLGADHDPAEWEQVTDILDVWFDSGSTHAFVLRDRADGIRPASLYLEGTDQHRGWFQSSLLQSCGTTGRAPYEAVLTHGFTLDGAGLKMSKSLGNVTAPEEVVRQYGADILRLWVAQTDYTIDQRIGPEILKGVADSYRRLRNTLRFLLGALADFDPAERIGLHEMPELDRWVLHRLAEIDATVREGYAAYDFQGVFQNLFQFATVDLSAFYFDVRKDVLYCDAAGSPRRRAARTVLDALYARLVAWLAPMLPFTMEEVWLERRPGEESSVHLTDFPATPGAWYDPALGLKWGHVRHARRVVTGALEIERRDKRIGASLEAAPVVHVSDPAMLAALQDVDFADVCITSDLTLTPDPAPADAFLLDDAPGVAVVPRLAPGAKCARCWKILPDVGRHAHPGVCARCNAALAG
ncbi:MAG: isoleucine--tRNA ligase [Rhodobacteraceae bacterium]|nr:isoleucine--tRNA ligase [Paracoccaceae bacterium]